MRRYAPTGEPSSLRSDRRPGGPERVVGYARTERPSRPECAAAIRVVVAENDVRQHHVKVVGTGREGLGDCAHAFDA
jgi:hypothetical protein